MLLSIISVILWASNRQDRARYLQADVAKFPTSLPSSIANNLFDDICFLVISQKMEIQFLLQKAEPPLFWKEFVSYDQKQLLLQMLDRIFLLNDCCLLAAKCHTIVDIRLIKM